MPPERFLRPFTALATCALVFGVVFGVPGALAQTDAQVVVDGTGGDGLNIRAEPDHLAPVLVLAPEGSRLTVTGPDVSSGGRRWRPVRTVGGASGWAASDFLIAVPSTATPTPTSTLIAAVQAESQPTSTRTPVLSPTTTPTPGPPLELEVRFKLPELESRDEQTIYVDVFRGTVPQPGIEVRFVVEDEDPEIERIASLTDERGRSFFTWHVRRYRGTTVVHVHARGPDGGEGKATKSFFVR